MLRSSFLSPSSGSERVHEQLYELLMRSVGIFVVYKSRGAAVTTPLFS